MDLPLAVDGGQVLPPDARVQLISPVVAPGDMFLPTKKVWVAQEQEPRRFRAPPWIPGLLLARFSPDPTHSESIE